MATSTPTDRKYKTARRVESMSSPDTTAAAGLGFDGLELAIGTIQDAEQVDAVLAAIHADHPSIVAVSATCKTVDPKTQAQIVITALTASARLGANCLNLTLPAIDTSDGDLGFPSYQSAINFVHELFSLTRFEAERSGVALAIEIASGGCFLSPIEMRDLVDTANTWAVGICLDIDRVAIVSHPADWIRTLTHRLHAVRFGCDPSTNDQLLQETASAIHDAAFDRTICVACGAGPVRTIEILQQEGILPKMCGGR